MSRDLGGLRGRLFLRSLLLQAGFSDERRQALGFAWALDPALRSAYALDPAGLSAARARHLVSFNTQPCAAGLILGTIAALEARAAAGEFAAAARAATLKSAAGAALAGSADALFWGALRPLAAASAVFVAVAGWCLGLPHPLVWGEIAGLAAFNAPALAARWAGIGAGLARGDAAIAAAARLPVQAWIRRARLTAAVLTIASALLATVLGHVAPAYLAGGCLVAGAGFSRRVGGPLRLAAGAGILAAAAAGWVR
ncbi:MAG: hypothetical protein A2X40_06500 [Elusimicrobia bacterium GWC2_65_9]|nr:MAG: hypothetical protein A2X37_04595 [Elusimicrobia bacterium GWA2_66_18]OGR74054.1 MAG: hypothetical protein A2X40_06500 [Elusimicrobia bacterium GWC2_65_9]